MNWDGLPRWANHMMLRSGHLQMTPKHWLRMISKSLSRHMWHMWQLMGSEWGYLVADCRRWSWVHGKIWEVYSSHLLIDLALMDESQPRCYCKGFEGELPILVLNLLHFLLLAPHETNKRVGYSSMVYKDDIKLQFRMRISFQSMEIHGIILCCQYLGCYPPWNEASKFAPENGWLEYSFPFGMAYFQVLCWFQGV